MYLNGECFVICGFYKYTLLASTEFNLTVPTRAQSGGAAEEERAREAGKPECQARRRGEAAWPNARRTEGPFSPATREAELGRPQGKLELRSKKKTGENLSFSCRGQKRNFAASSKNGRDADFAAVCCTLHHSLVLTICDFGYDAWQAEISN